ncbi:MAG TPA: ABC transporter ATP-binding protein [Solirubrobacteraceae bacterium]|nr:ABC transporter ATP-binding protein [Solirubrobacteraceae bacterium]
MAPAPVLSIKGLKKTYDGGFTALHGLDMEIGPGRFVGLLGPNGAGKSTLIGSVCNLVIPSAGEIRIAGHDYRSREARHLVGLCEQEINLDRFLSIEQILVYHGGYHGLTRREARHRARELMEIFRLSDKARNRAEELSGGMRRRVLFARALMHRPLLLILDEPTAGVDIDLRAELWSYIRGLHADGTSVLLTTHYLEEAEELCEEIVLLRAGRVIARDTSERLRAHFGADDIAGVYAQAMSAEFTV